MTNTLLRGRGIRQITAGLGNFDREVFEAVAESPSSMVHTLLRDEPVRIRYDGKTLQTSLFFLGNSGYLPTRIARDGEVGTASPRAHFTASYRALHVYQPSDTGS